MAGIGTWEFGPVAVFFLLAAMAVFSPLSELAIPADAIDNDVARGLPDGDRRQREQLCGFAAADLSAADLPICIVLFNLANAAMRPPFGQKLALEDKYVGTDDVGLRSCGTARPSMAILVGREADRGGRKPLFLAGFFIIPIRGVASRSRWHRRRVVRCALPTDRRRRRLFGVSRACRDRGCV